MLAHTRAKLCLPLHSHRRIDEACLHEVWVCAPAQAARCTFAPCHTQVHVHSKAGSVRLDTAGGNVKLAISPNASIDVSVATHASVKCTDASELQPPTTSHRYTQIVVIFTCYRTHTRTHTHHSAYAALCRRRIRRANTKQAVPLPQRQP